MTENTLLTSTDNNSSDDNSDDHNIDNKDIDNQSTDDNTDDKSNDDNKDDKSSDDNKDDKSGDDKDKGDDDKSDDDKPEGAPESYEEFELPEGIEINETDLSALHDMAKDLDLNQEQAQKIVDLESKRAEARVEAMTEAFNKQQEDWVQELKNDKDFGGDNLDKNIGLAVKVINKFGGEELKATLDKTGMGNNPDLIKLLNRVGKAFSEDSLDDSGNNNNQETGKTLAEKIYPDQNS